MKTITVKATAAAALLAVVLPQAAGAADVSPVPDASDWQFELVLYGWAAGLNGQAAVFGLHPLDVDLSFSEVVQNLDFAAMAMGEARNGRFMLGMDATYTNVGDPVSVSALAPGLANSLDVTNTSWMVTGVAGYSIFEDDVARLDVMAGGRMWSVNNQFDIQGGLLDGLSESADASWFDPLVGAKLRLELAPELHITSWGMIGGFGVGSDLMWDVMGGVGYDFSEHFGLFAGYRATSVDYSDDGFIYDIVEHGPLAALTMKF